jgi:hypothetical protein
MRIAEVRGQIAEVDPKKFLNSAIYPLISDLPLTSAIRVPVF